MTGRRGRITVRIGAALAATAAALVIAGIVALTRHRGELRRRQERFDAIIRDAANRHGISPHLVKAVVWQESRFRPQAVGRKGEAGLMQLMDGAVTDWSRETGQRKPSRGLCFDPNVNIEIGTWYLARALRRWQGHVSAEELALVEYNAGRQRALEWAPKEPDRELQPSEVRAASTREYIRSVKSKRRQYEKEQGTREQG